MEAKTLILLVLSWLMDSDDKTSTHEKNRSWIKRRIDTGYFNNIIPELMIEDSPCFKEMFRMSVRDFEFASKHIDDIRSFENMNKYLTNVTLDPMLGENPFNPA